MHTNHIILISLQIILLVTTLAVNSQAYNEVGLDEYLSGTDRDGNNEVQGEKSTCNNKGVDDKKSPTEQNEYLQLKPSALNAPPAGGNRRMNSYKPLLASNPNLISNNNPQSDQPQANDRNDPFQPHPNDPFQPQSNDPFQPQSNNQFQPQSKNQFQPQSKNQFQPQSKNQFQPQPNDQFQVNVQPKSGRPDAEDERVSPVESNAQGTPCKNPTGDQVLYGGRRSLDLESRSNRGVTCYACSNVSSPFCIEPNDQTLVKICSNANACVKKIIRTEGITALVRDCGDNCDTPYSEKALSCKICRGDLCNGAFSITSGSFTFNTIGSMIIFFVFKFM